MEILRSGDFSAILGIREDIRIEFKRELNLKADSGKHRFAKAVAGLANSGGGLLLVGVESERDPTTRADYASRLTYVSSGDESIYYKAVSAFLYPLVRVTTQAFGAAPKHLIAIEVGSADLEAPILVTQTVGEALEGGAIFGYYKRTEIESTHVRHAEVHALIQAGQKLQQLGNLQGSMAEIATQIAILHEEVRALGERKDL